MTDAFLAPRADPGNAFGFRPSFDVVIPTFNDADVLPDALRSLEEQSERPSRVVVVDDGSASPVDAAFVNAAAPGLADRIEVLQVPHLGAPGARNAGASRCSGDFIVLFDADDVWHPERLRRLADLAQARPDLDVLCSDGWIEAAGKIVGPCYNDAWRFPVEDQRRAVISANFIVNSAAFRRTRWEALGGLNPVLLRADDWEILGRFVLGGARVGCVAERLMTYRLRVGRLTGDHVRRLEGNVAVLTLLCAHPSLSALEYAVAQESLRLARRDLAARRASAAVQDGSPHARALAWAVVRDNTQSPKVRARAGAGALLPGLARRVLAARSARSGVELIGGHRVTLTSPQGGSSS